jgi:glycosyltransferase involved in cell wall biosynthesis
MKALLIHEHGRSFGSGGVIAMYRLHRSLRNAGVESTIACRKRELDEPQIVELPRSDFLEDLLGKFSWRLGLNDVHCVSSFKVTRFKPFLDADVVNIHGMHSNFFNYLALPRLSRHKPVILTLHDMWNLTGHCAQSNECERWKTGCGHCPHLGAFPPVSRDATRIEWKLKNWAYQRSNVTIVSPSRWLMKLCAQSILSHFPIHHVPNAADVELFRPLDQRECRSALNIPHDKRVLMFASAALNDPMKGGPLLLESLRTLPSHIKESLVLLLLGDQGEEMSRAASIPAIGLGYVKDDQTKVMAYNAADVFVLPSRAENHSLVLLEAMACGTPCAAFDVGGNSEIVRHLQTGFLARRDEASDLSAGIAQLLDDNDFRIQAGAASREVIVREFSLAQHTQRYIELFRSAIDGRTSSAA